MLDYIRRQAEDGVDFMTIHAGLTLKAIDKLKKKPRLAGIVSRGGSMLTGWMLHNKKENPFFEHFDQLLEIAREFDVTLSLGDGLRPGALADGSDWAQLEELLTLGELVQRSRRAGVQVMVEGPGHLPLQQVEMNIRLQKEVCAGAPFLRPGPGGHRRGPRLRPYHRRHRQRHRRRRRRRFPVLRHPGRAPRPARRAGRARRDHGLAHRRPCRRHRQGLAGALDWDRRMADARRRLDWAGQEKLCIDPEKFRRVRERRGSRDRRLLHVRRVLRVQGPGKFPIMKDEFSLTFFGVRGSYPVPGKATRRYRRQHLFAAVGDRRPACHP